tara:strand:+ start:587 stop:877 length:291 start_codon:yes stop_codon:yes gene_type:complete
MTRLNLFFMLNKVEFNDKNLKEKIQTILYDDFEVKKWNDGIWIKLLLIIPIIIFIIGLFIMNRPEKLSEIIFVLFYPLALILLGLIILLFMTRKFK